MSTPNTNRKEEVHPEGQTPEGIKKINNPSGGKGTCYKKPTITLVNKGVSTRKVNSTNDACGGCVLCDYCDAGCDACYTCDICDGCYDCDGCVGCDSCDSACMGCEVCDGYCDFCDAGCDVCVGCDVCDAGCDACDGCVGCDVCDAGCDACVGCVDCETCVTEDTSLPVTLTTFEAVRKSNSVSLSWRTEAEVNNLGFFLFKGLDQAGPFEPVNTQIIPGAGSSSEAHDYEYVDYNVDNGTTYWYLLEDVDINGETTTRGPIACKPAGEEGQTLSNNFRLSTNYPNPFNAQTTFSIIAPEDGLVEVDIVDVRGRIIKTLLKGPIQSGPNILIWDGSNNRGTSVPSGTYVCRARFKGGETFTVTQKISYIR